MIQKKNNLGNRNIMLFAALQIFTSWWWLICEIVWKVIIILSIEWRKNLHDLYQR